MREKPEPKYFSTQVLESRRFYLELNPNSEVNRGDLTSDFGLPPSAKRQPRVVSGGWERCLPDYDIERPGFPYLIIEFVSRGVGTLTLLGRDYELKPGMVFIYGEGVPHRIQASREHGLTKYFVAVAGEGARALLEECHIDPVGVSHVMHPGEIQQVFNDLITHGLSDHANRQRMCNVALQYLVMKIADLTVPEGDPSMAAVGTYRRCREFIEENFLSVHSLQEVASACHIDSAYLCRLFRRFRRQTPFQYLQNLKMNRAVDLLQGGRYTVKETAQELGFADPYNFSRAFKRVFGISPGKLLEKQGSGG